MSAAIKVFRPESKEYKALCATAALMNFADEEKTYVVRDVYFDYGQDWFWTTIIARKYDNKSIVSSWQALNPREQEEIVFAEKPSDFANFVEKYFKERK